MVYTIQRSDRRPTGPNAINDRVLEGQQPAPDMTRFANIPTCLNKEVDNKKLHPIDGGALTSLDLMESGN